MVARIRQETMNKLKDVIQLRVRYSETDQMGTFYNSRALEWFECGRTELMRNRLGMSYAALEEKGVFLPLVEAHLEFQGGARYDDLLRCSIPWNCRTGEAAVRRQIAQSGSGQAGGARLHGPCASRIRKANRSGRRGGFWKC